MSLLPQPIADRVAIDHLPRQAVADDDFSRHVFYFDGFDGVVRSMAASDWPPPLPSDPTQAQSAAAVLALQQAVAQQATDAAALRTRVLTLAQSAIGVQIDALSAPQTRALLVLLLYKQGAITTAGAVRALTDWL